VPGLKKLGSEVYLCHPPSVAHTHRPARRGRARSYVAPTHEIKDPLSP